MLKLKRKANRRVAEGPPFAASALGEQVKGEIRGDGDQEKESVAGGCCWGAHAEHWEDAIGVRHYCGVSED